MSDTQAPEVKEKTRQMSFNTLDDGRVRAEFGEGIEPVVFMPASLPESLFPMALAAGVISRLRGYTSRLVGEGRTPEALRAAIVKGLADLNAGVWTQERESGPGEISIEAEAAFVYRQKRAEAKGETYNGTLEDAAKDFAALTDDQRKTLKALPRYQLAYAEVKARKQAERAEKLAKKVIEQEEDIPF